MKRQFIQGEANTHDAHRVNCLIMEQASDIAARITDEECYRKGLDLFKDDEGDSVYTEEAQDIFNGYYDAEMDRLYNLVNDVLNELNETRVFMYNPDECQGKIPTNEFEVMSEAEAQGSVYSLDKFAAEYNTENVYPSTSRILISNNY